MQFLFKNRIQPRTENREMLNAHAGYYDVHIRVNNDNRIYRVFAHSDYAAAVQVRKMTGVMPASEHDVEFLAPQTAAENITKAFDMFAA